MRLIFLSLFATAVSSCSNNITTSGSASGIRNTATFITYFNGIENMVAFNNIKDSVQNLAREIKNSTAISSANKTILESYYTAMQLKSENLYNKVVNDLMNKEKRREIKSNAAGYIQSINNQFDEIKSSGEAFTLKYKEVVGQTRGFFIGWFIKSFLLPFAKTFVDEIINDLVRQQLDKHLKPKLVIQPWSNI